MDRLHKIHLVDRKATRRVHMVLERLTRKQKKPLVLMTYGQICGRVCPMQQRRKQNKDAQVRPAAIFGNAGHDLLILLMPTRARSRSCTHLSSRSHQCKRDQFYDLLESRPQIHSDAPSNENSKCKGSSGKKMENERKFRHGS